MDKEEEEIFLEMKGQIEKMTDTEVKALADKAPLRELDVEAIREKKVKEYLDQMKNQMEETAYQLLPFFDQIREDSLSLFNKICQPIDPEELNRKLVACKTLGEIKKVCNRPLLPEDLREIKQLGESWFKAEQYDKAQLYYLYLTAVESGNEKNWLAKGMTEQNMGLYQEAIGSYFFAIRLSPTHLFPYLLLIDCLILSDKLDEARQFFEVLEREVSSELYAENRLYISKIDKIRQYLQRAAA
jgi:tetratricopeptide (TPR) repeat protein